MAVFSDFPSITTFTDLGTVSTEHTVLRLNQRPDFSAERLQSLSCNTSAHPYHFTIKNNTGFMSDLGKLKQKFG
jgi:hypothetical protein